jgi:hypothetical protein
VADFIDIFGRTLHVAWIDDKLGDVIRELKKGRSHMALVRAVNSDDPTKDPFYELKGIITLEDIIEEILGTSSRPQLGALYIESISTLPLYLQVTKSLTKPMRQKARQMPRKIAKRLFGGRDCGC